MTKMIAGGLLESKVDVVLVYRNLFRIAGVARGAEVRNWVKESEAGGAPVEVRAIHVPETIYMISNMLFALIGAVLISRAVRSQRESGNYVILHAVDTVYSGLACAMASRITGAEYVVHTHGIRRQYMQYASGNKAIKAIHFAIEKRVIRKSSMLISVNRRAKEFWTAHGVEPEKIRIIPVPIQLERFSPSAEARNRVRNQLGIESDAVVFGYIGRLSKEKSVDTLLNAFLATSLRAKLLVVGDGPEREALARIARRSRGNGSVIFTGFRDDIPDIVNAIDVLVLPSLSEGMSSVVLEGQSNGKSVIASDIPENREVISEGCTGVLFKPGATEDLMRAINTLRGDAELRSRLGQNALAVVERYDARLIVSELLRVYGDVLASRGSAYDEAV